MIGQGKPVNWVWILLLVMGLPGCSGRLTTNYGPSKGFTARRSVNGFSALRDGFEANGFRHRDLHRLTNRSRASSVIVWTPDHATSVGSQTAAWMERWLAMGNKSLIYVIPDSGSESAFYAEARQHATPSQRLEYRRLYAESLIQEHRWHLRRGAIQVHGWFIVHPKVQSSRLVPSSDVVADADNEAASVPPARKTRVEWMLTAYDQETQTAGNVAAWEQTGPAQPGASAFAAVASAGKTRLEIEFQPIIETDQGDVVVARLTTERWNNSQILVVAGGSLLTNFALTHEENQQLAKQLIDATKTPLIEADVIDEELGLLSDGSEPQAAFASAAGGFPISVRVEGIPRASGAELLTVFPLSLVTIHIAVLGFVVCLMLLPVFGRPKRLSRTALTHFGDHLDAVAALMRRRGGESYARRRISDYMKRVRGETSGRWVLDDPKPSPTVSAKPVAKAIESTAQTHEASPANPAPQSDPTDSESNTVPSNTPRSSVD